MFRDKTKLIGFILGLILFSITVTSLTYAYYAWQSSNTNITFNINDQYFYCETDIDSGISNLSPVNDYKDGVLHKFKVNNVANKNTTFSVTMNIESIDEVLKDPSFKYKLMVDKTNGSNNCQTGASGCEEVASGNFSNVHVGNNNLVPSITLPNNSRYEYYFFMYIDGAMNNPSGMQSASMVSTLGVCDIYVTFDTTEGETTVSPVAKKVIEGDTYGTLPTPVRSNAVVTYNYNGATGGNSVASDTVSFTFGGWYKEQAFTNQVTSSTLVTSSINHTVYPKWTKSKTIILPTPTRTGYIFEGWYSDSSFNNKVGDGGGSYNPSKSTPLYAKWKQANYMNTNTNALYMTLNEALSDVSSNQTIKVLVGVTETETATLASGKTGITLDLNGKTTTIDGMPITNNGGLTVVSNISGGVLTGGGSAIINTGTGNLTVSSGVITALWDPLRNEGTGTIMVTGGTITATYSYYAIVNNSTGTVSISNGTVTGVTGGIDNYSTGIVNVSGGTIQGIIGIGGGAGTVNISGGSINGSSTGISVSTGTLVITSGQVSGAGVGVFLSGVGTLTMGQNTGTPSITNPIISATDTSDSYGVRIENSNATYNFYDGKVSSASGTNTSIYYSGTINTPSSYEVVKSTNNGVETAILSRITYSITYMDCGNTTFSGTHGNNYPQNYTVGSGATLDSPTKTGYTFGGYYSSSACSGTAVTNISSGDSGNKTFYAKWTTNTYTVHHSANPSQCNLSIPDDTVTYEQEYNPYISYNNETGASIVEMKAGIVCPGYSLSSWTATGINTATSQYETSTTDELEWISWNGSTPLAPAFTQTVIYPIFKNLTPTNNAEVTMISNWTPVNYNINYTLNGGTKVTSCQSGASPTTGTYDSIVRICPPTKTVTVSGNANGTGVSFTNPSTGQAQTFTGWTSTTIGSNAKYSEQGTAFGNWNGSLTNYQFYKNLKNYGTVTMVANWTPVAVTLPTFNNPAGKTCNWYTEQSGGTLMGGSGASWTPPADSASSVTAYLRCTANPTYTVTYNSGVNIFSLFNEDMTQWGISGGNPTFTKEIDTSGSHTYYTIGGTPEKIYKEITLEPNTTYYFSVSIWNDNPNSVLGSIRSESITGTSFCNLTIPDYEDSEQHCTFTTSTETTYYVVFDFGGSAGNEVYFESFKLKYTNLNGNDVIATEEKTVTYGLTYGTQPTYTKAGYTFAGWYTQTTGGTQITSNTTVTATSDHTLYAHWTLNNPTAPTISGGTTKVYGYTATNLSCNNTTAYEGVTKYYKFGYSTTSGGSVTWLGSATTTGTKSIAAREFIGTRYYKCRIYVTDGISTSSTVTSSSSTTMSLVRARINFDATTNGGSLTGSSSGYIEYDQHVYDHLINSRTTTGSIIFLESIAEITNYSGKIYSQPSANSSIIEDLAGSAVFVNYGSSINGFERIADDSAEMTSGYTQSSNINIIDIAGIYATKQNKRFTGWWTAATGGYKVIDEFGQPQKNIGGWTNSSGNFILTSASDTSTANKLYAQFEDYEFNITYKNNYSNSTNYNGLTWTNSEYLNFDGVDDFVNLGQINNDYATYSVSFMATNLNGTQQQLIGNEHAGGGGIFINTSNQLVGEFYIDGEYKQVYTPNAITANTRYSATVTYDGSTVRLYVNGSEVGTAVSVTGVISPPRGYNTDQEPTRLVLGANPEGNHAEAYFFKGRIYSVEVYDRGLTAAEVLVNYNGTSIANDGAVKIISNQLTTLDQVIYKKVYGSTLGTQFVPDRPGYTFAGWYTAASGGTQVTSSTAVPADNTTYYAHWTAAPVVPVRLHGIGGIYSQWNNITGKYSATYNDGTGHTANTTNTWWDMSGSGHTGAVGSGITWGDDYASFDGTANSYVSLQAQNAARQTLMLTFSTTDASTNQYIFGNWHAGGGGIRISSGKILGEFYIGGDWRPVNTGVSVVNNKKYSVALTYDGSAVTAYVDGVQKGTPYSITGSIGAPTNSTAMMMGCNPKGTACENNYFKGKIYEAAIRSDTIDSTIIEYNHGNTTSYNSNIWVPNAARNGYNFAGWFPATITSLGFYDENNRIYPNQLFERTDITELNLYAKWTPIIASGTFNIKPANSNYCLEPYNNGTADNTGLRIYSCNSSRLGQKWKITQMGDGYVRIYNPNASNKSITIKDGTVGNGKEMVIYTWSGAFQQRWLGIETTNGYQLASAKGRGYGLHVVGDTFANNKTVELNTLGTTAGYIWTFVAVS